MILFNFSYSYPQTVNKQNCSADRDSDSLDFGFDQHTKPVCGCVLGNMDGVVRTNVSNQQGEGIFGK